MQILGADAQNAYLNAPVREKVFTTCGPEFGNSTEGRYAIIVRALYGLKSSGAAWRAHLAATMEELMFTSCIALCDYRSSVVWSKVKWSRMACSLSCNNGRINVYLLYCRSRRLVKTISE
jgi:hypothetical protein